MKKTALLLVLTMLVSVFSCYGAVFAEETTPVNGPQEGAFSVSATEPTTLSGVRFTETSAADWAWASGSYCQITADANTQQYVSYDLDVEEAGSYQVTVRAVAYDDGINARLYRQGRVTQSTGVLGGGDVVLAEGYLKSTDGAWSPQNNDFGVIRLEEGLNQIALSSLLTSAKSFYFISMTLTPVEEDAPLVFGLRDAKEMNPSKTFINNITNHAVPFIQFFGNEYHLYDVTIPEDGLYSFTAYGSYSHKLTLTDVTDSENPVALVTDAVTSSTGTGSSASPAEVAKISLKAGTYTYKLSNSVSSHYSYFTLEKIADTLGEKEIFIADGETVKISRSQASAYSPHLNTEFPMTATRDYTVYAETAGVYDIILSYATPSDAIKMSVSVDGAKYIADLPLAATGQWGNYGEVNIGAVSMKQGTNVIRLENSGTASFNSEYFKIAPKSIAKVTASACTNVETDALTTMSYNGGKAVSLSEGQKLDFTVTVPEDGVYELKAEMSATKGYRLAYLSEGENDLLDALISGDEHGAWKTESLGEVELTAGEHTLSFKLYEGGKTYVSSIMLTSDSIDTPVPSVEPSEEPSESPSPEPSGKGPQEEAFAVSGTETTELSPLYFTVDNVSGTSTWYDSQSFATLDVAPYTHHSVGYDLDVEKAGAYRVVAKIAAPAEGSVAQLVRKGKNITDSNDVANGCGDVVLSKTSVKKTANSSTVAENDMGVIWLDEGITRVSLANDRDGGKAFYYYGLTLTPVDEEAPVVVSVRDAKELKASDGTDKAVIGYPANYSARAPFIQFFSGDYMIYDVDIHSDGVYSFTTFQEGANTYTVTDITDSENPVTLINQAYVPGNDDGTIGITDIVTPYEVAQLSLTKGTYTIKISAGQSNHFSYFTLRRLGDIPEVKAINLPVGADVKINYNEFSAFKHSAGLDFTDLDENGDMAESWREYTVNAEQAGDYKIVINYSLSSATDLEPSIYIHVNGEEVLDTWFEATGDDWATTHAQDYEVGTISLNKGINVIKLVPENTFNMPHFTLVQQSAVVLNASDAANAEPDALGTIGYDGTTSVMLKAGQKLDITVETEKSGWYVLRTLASATVGTRKISVKNGEDVLLETTVKGQQHGEYANEVLGMIYLAEGENTISVSLDAGYQLYFNTFAICKPTAALYYGETEASKIKVGDLTAKVNLEGLYEGETKTVYFAVYEKDSYGTRLAYFNMEDIEIQDGNAEISVLVDSIKAGYTYFAKVFILDNMSGFFYEF